MYLNVSLKITASKLNSQSVVTALLF